VSGPDGAPHAADGRPPTSGHSPTDALVGAPLNQAWIAAIVATALEEDLGPERRDVTTQSTISPEVEATAHLVARADGVLAGLPVLPVVLAQTAAALGLPTRPSPLTVTGCAAATSSPCCTGVPRFSSSPSARCSTS
jgi:hypothetical protein